MNQAYKSLLALAAALLLSPVLGAQNLPEDTYAERNGVAYRNAAGRACSLFDCEGRSCSYGG